MGQIKNYNSAPDLGAEFTSTVQPSAATRLGNVAANHQFTFLADMDHRDAVIHELIAKPETLQALSNAGVKHIMLESLTTSENGMLDAYAKGALSDRTLQYYFKDMTSFNLGNSDASSQLHQKALYDLVHNARDYGLSVQGVNGGEGLADRETLKSVMETVSNMDIGLLTAIDKSPDYMDMSRAQQATFVQNTMRGLDLSDGMIQSQLGIMGFVEKDNTDLDMDDDMILARLAGDVDVADRISEYASGEKAVIVYGGGHMLRAENDLDASLPDSAVVSVYADKSYYEDKTFPGMVEDAQDMGITFPDPADYAIDFKSSTWSDNHTGEISPITVPAVDSLPPMPRPRPEHQMAGPEL